MPFVNDTKPTSVFVNDAEATLATFTTMVGNPIGLLLALTYASSSYSSGEAYTNDTENSSTYSNDSKPS